MTGGVGESLYDFALSYINEAQKEKLYSHLTCSVFVSPVVDVSSCANFAWFGLNLVVRLLMVPVELQLFK